MPITGAPRTRAPNTPIGDAAHEALSNASGPDEEGWLELVLTFEHEEAAVYGLAGFGGTIGVRTPTSVHARLVETATATLSRYPQDT